MPQPTIQDINFENLIFDEDVQKQVEANLITDKIKGDQNSQEKPEDKPADKPAEKTPEEIAAEAEAAKATEANKPQNQEEDEDENPITTMLLTALGVEVDGEFDDTSEGVNNLLNKAIPKIVETKLKETLSTHPILEKFAEFVMNGGDPENFLRVQMPETDYSKITLANDDIATQESLVKTFFAKQGISNEKAEQLIKNYKDTNLLFGQAEAALEVLAKQQAAEQQNLIANQAKAKEQQEKENAATWKAIQDKINAGKIKEATIPIAERTAFLEYISKPVDKQGNTQADLDAAQADLDMNLLMDYMRFKKLDLTKLIDAGVKTKMAQTKQEKLRLKEKSSGSEVQHRAAKNPTSALEGIQSPLDFVEVKP